MTGDPEVERPEGTPFLFQAKFRMADHMLTNRTLTRPFESEVCA